MEIEIRDIAPEEAAPYGENADIVLTGRKAVVFTDADGNVGRLYMKEEDIDLLGKQYIAENSTLEYSKVCEEWFPKVSWNAYKNDPQRNPPKTIDVEFVCDMNSERTEIWRRLDTGSSLGATSAEGVSDGCWLGVPKSSSRSFPAGTIMCFRSSRSMVTRPSCST